jgi:hypothetical protein
MIEIDFERGGFMRNLELDFVDDSKSFPPHHPRAHVFVQFSTGNKYITQTCMTISEFDGEIDRLEKELKNIRSRGHAKFAAAQEKEARHESAIT